MITQSQAGAGGTQPLRPGENEPDRRGRDATDNWKPSEKEEFARWQREEAKIAEERLQREENVRRDQEERAWRFHFEKQRRDQEERGKTERERQEWDRTRAERERQEREGLERDRRDRERQELLRIERERAERERDERERIEEERIMNQLQKEELDEQKEREDHLKQLEEEQLKQRNLEQARLRGLSRNKGSKEFLDSIEALSADEVEREFQRRVEEDKKRRESAGVKEVGNFL